MKRKTKAKADKTQISISLPEDLVKRVDEMAEKENRNRSNFISNTLTRLAEEQAKG